MGFISDYGTGCAALTLALASFGISAPAHAEPGVATLELSITGLRSTKGFVLICVTTNPKGFPDCSKDASARKIKVAAGSAASVAVPDLAPGTYAVSLIHDENGNGKMDTAMMMPKEGYGFTRNPKIRFGPPKFADAAIALSTGSNRHGVKVSYFL